MTIKRALVLSGGGSKAAYQIGAIKALLECGYCWNGVYGVSAGALIAAWLSMFKPEEQNYNFNGLINIWNNIKSSADIYKPWAPFYINYIFSLWKGSLYSGKPLRNILKNFFNVKYSRSSGVKLSVGCCSLTTGNYHSFDQTNDNIFEYILASSHIPVIFEPLLIEKQIWVDGGIRCQIPIYDALKDNPQEIDIIVTQPISIPHETNNKFKSAINVSLRSALIYSEQIYYEDFMYALKISKETDKPKINFYIPNYLLIKNSLNFDPNLIKETIKIGYSETLAALIKIK